MRLALFLLQATCISQPATLPSVDQRWNAARERAHAIACEKLAPNIPGFAIAVAVDGKLVWSEASGAATAYGIGWFVATDTLGHRYVFHGGGSVGGTTAFGVDRDSHMVIALVTNLSDARLDAAREIQMVFDSAATRP